MKSFALLVVSTVLGLSPACKKSDTPAPAAGSAATGSAAPAIADHVVVLAKHRPAKPTDPVTVRFERFKVVQASFDPANPEGGTATIELDLASLKSGDTERDDDLKSSAYIDVGQFATATIEIANVKHAQDKTFTADASVKLRGATKTYPVTFDVIDQRADSIQIKGEHTFSRLDFAVGADPAAVPDTKVDTELTIQMVVTLNKT